MSQNGDSGFEFFKGVLFGGIVGAVVTLLYAPKSGKEVREDLRKRSLELRDDAEAKLELAQQKAEALLAETKAELDKLRVEATSTVDELKGSAETAIAEGKQVVGKEATRLKGALDAGVAAYKEEKNVKRKK